MHTLRKTYGWLDSQIIDEVEVRGVDWLMSQYRYCKEDELNNWSILLNVVPIARTPLSKDVGKAIGKAEQEIRNNLISVFTPWRNAHEERRKAFKRKYGLESGEIGIVLGAGEAGLGKDLAGGNDIKIIKG